MQKLTLRALAFRQANLSDEGQTLETSAFKLFTVAQFHFQLI